MNNKKRKTEEEQEEEDEIRLLYCNWAIPLRVVGVRMEGDGVLHVMLERNVHVRCVEREKMHWLKVVGKSIQLFNVMMERGMYWVTKGTAVVLVNVTMVWESVEKTFEWRIKEDRSKTKWFCHGCQYQNFPSRSTCWKCHRTKKG